jgi:alpha/beta superfamily hydrolase
MSEQLFIQGSVGKIEVFVDYPVGEVKGFAVVCHPHPLQGGTPQHKVPAFLHKSSLNRVVWYIAQVFVVLDVMESMMKALAETEDILDVIKHVRQLHKSLPFYVGGFSFGAHVMAKAIMRYLMKLNRKQVILCGLPTSTVDGLRHYVTPAIKGDILFVHGEADPTTKLSDLLEWAKPQRHLITVLPGANHFFTGYLKQLRIAISRFLLVP